MPNVASSSVLSDVIDQLLIIALIYVWGVVLGPCFVMQCMEVFLDLVWQSSRRGKKSFVILLSSALSVLCIFLAAL